MGMPFGFVGAWRLSMVVMAVAVAASGCGGSPSPTTSSSGAGGSDTTTSSSGTGGGSTATSSSGTGGADCVPVDDSNPCTDDVCIDGMPENPNKTQGAVCGMEQGATLVCDGTGMCVGCNAPSDCPGADDDCKTRTCMAGVCGVAFTAANTSLTAQTAGDCSDAVCDGSGNVSALPNDSDLPADDGNACTSEACHAGAPSHPEVMNGTVCADGDACTLTDTCQSGACVGGNPILCNGGASCLAGACVAPRVPRRSGSPAGCPRTPV
jgi:hypothetical protein